MAIHHLHGVVKVEITGEASGSLRIPSKQLKAGSGVGLGRCDRVAWLGGFRPGDVAIDVSIRFGKSRESVQGGLGKFFTTQIVDTNGNEAGEVFVVDACRGSCPVNESRVGELLRKGRGAGRLEEAKYGANWEAFGVCKVAGGVRMGWAFARRARAGVGGERGE